MKKPKHTYIVRRLDGQQFGAWNNASDTLSCIRGSEGHVLVYRRRYCGRADELVQVSYAELQQYAAEEEQA